MSYENLKMDYYILCVLHKSIRDEIMPQMNHRFGSCTVSCIREYIFTSLNSEFIFVGKLI